MRVGTPSKFMQTQTRKVSKHGAINVSRELENTGRIGSNISLRNLISLRFRRALGTLRWSMYSEKPKTMCGKKKPMVHASVQQPPSQTRASQTFYESRPTAKRAYWKRNTIMSNSNMNTVNVGLEMQD